MFESSFGSDGTNASFFAFPAAVSIDQSTGDIYVGDSGVSSLTEPIPATVQRFDSAHGPDPFTGMSPELTEGKIAGFGTIFTPQLAVNASSHVFYVESDSMVRAYEPEGEPSEFTGGTNQIVGSEICGVAVDSTGDLYVSEFATGVRVFTPTGEPLTTIPASDPCNLAVDSHGTVYVNILPEGPQSGHAGPVQKFIPSGFPVTSSTTYELGGTVDQNAAYTVAVDPGTDHLYVDEGSQIAEYDEAGNRLGTFGASEPGQLQPPGANGVGLSVNGASGKVYVGQGNFDGRVEVFGPAVLLPDVTTGQATEISPKGRATLTGSVNADGEEVVDCHFDYGTSASYGQTAPCEQAVGSGNNEVAVKAQIANLKPGTTYLFRLEASNTNGANFGEQASFTTPSLPSIGVTEAINLSATSVDLRSEIHPEGLTTDCLFEYGKTTSYETSIPCEPASLEGSGGKLVTKHIEPLEPNETYHWRVVVSSEAGTVFGSDHTFVYDMTGERLPDNRAYEMVTPVHKNGALVSRALFSLGVDVAAGGSRVIGSSVQCFAYAESCDVAKFPVGSSYLFERTSTAWVATPLTPPASQFEVSTTLAVSPESGEALFEIPAPSTAEFLLRRPDGSFASLAPVSPPCNSGACGNSRPFATGDFSRVVYQAKYEGSEQPAEFSNEGDTQPVLVGVTGQGSNDTDLISRCGAEPNAISADGETVYFKAKRCAGGSGVNFADEVPADEMFARIDGMGADAHTAPISEPAAFGPAAPSPSCNKEPCIKNVNDKANWESAEFAGVSSDGSKVFFTTTQQLTDQAIQGVNNIYEYDFDGAAGQNLVDISARDVNEHDPGVEGLVAISSDGTHVYFVARGVLTTALNQQRRGAQDGENNLYVFERDPTYPGGHLAFVTTLPEVDNLTTEASHPLALWANVPHLANVTPDGNFLVFPSFGGLTPDTSPSKDAAQIYRYDARSGELVRISIGEHGFNDDGNAGKHDAEIVSSELGTAVAGPGRSDPTMSDDGSYVFFESPVALTSHALKEVKIGTGEPPFDEPTYAQNVYEWHEGQVILISDGRDTGVSGEGDLSAVELFGSDATGSNVFFSTADPLVSQDTDTQVDIYDARICTATEPCISEPPAPLPACAGEVCHGIPAESPSASSMPTATLNGDGNLVRSTSSRSSSRRQLTRTQKLMKALKACRRADHGKRRKSCEVMARRAYGHSKTKRSPKPRARKRNKR